MSVWQNIADDHNAIVNFVNTDSHVWVVNTIAHGPILKNKHGYGPHWNYTPFRAEFFTHKMTAEEIKQS